MTVRCMGCMEEYDGQFEVCPHCGYLKNAAPAEAYHLSPGTILNHRYIVGKALGFGGFGVTYIGYDTRLELKIAIKEYLPSEFSTRVPNQTQVTVYSGQREEQFNEGKEKVIEEARRLSALSNIPSVISVYSCFEENNTAYIVMELCEGESIKSILEREGKFPPDQAKDIILQVIAGMKQVHAAGLLHRDIAPDNIYITPDGSVKILDFGAARYASSQLSKSLSVIVKAGYSPIEQYRSKGDQGPWTDVYALAGTYYTMLTGITPEDSMDRAIRDTLARPTRIGVDISGSVETALFNAMHVRIEDRTQSMEEFEKELNADHVDARKVTKKKSDLGKIPAAIKVGAAAAAAVILIVFSATLRKRGPDAQTIGRNETYVPNFVNLIGEDEVGNMGKQYQVTPLYRVSEYSLVIPEGAITAQDISPGSVVAKNAEIGLTRSRGRQKAQVPQLLGLLQEEAKTALEEAGLQYEIELIEDPNSPSNTVVAQSIPANADNIDRGSFVVLKVAQNTAGADSDPLATELEALPDFTGLTEEEAKERNNNLFSISFRHEYSDSVEKDKIISQKDETGNDLLPEEMLLSGTHIVLTISDGIEQIMVPQDIITDMNEQQARAALEERGFVVSVVRAADYSNTPEGYVQSLSLTPGRMYDKGSAITVTISRGPQPVRQTEAADPRPAETRQETTAAMTRTEAPAEAVTQAETAPPETAPPETAAPVTSEAQPEAGPEDVWNDINDLIGF